MVVFRIFRNAKLQREVDPIGDLGAYSKSPSGWSESARISSADFQAQSSGVRATHPPFVLHHLAGADGHHHVVRLVVAPLQKMHTLVASNIRTPGPGAAVPGCICVAASMPCLVHLKRNSAPEDIAKLPRSGAPAIVRLIAMLISPLRQPLNPINPRSGPRAVLCRSAVL